VQRFRHSAPDLVLALERAVRDAAGPHAGGRLLGAKAPDEGDRDQRRGDEHGVVEDQLVARYAVLVVQHGRGEDERDGGEERDQHPDALTLDVRVDREEGEGDEPDRTVGLRHHRLDHAEHHQVAGGDQRVQGAVGPPLGEDEVEEPPGESHQQDDRREPPFVRKTQDGARRECHQGDGQPREGEDEDWLARRERQPLEAGRHVRPPRARDCGAG
jgi:hypothetical protein